MVENNTDSKEGFSSLMPFYTKEDFTRTNPVDNVGEESYYRSNFWRDRARLMHSPSFRRLRGKTQLFPTANSDFFRCRLTHSLEVANIGKTITRRLNWRIISQIKDKYLGKDISDKDLEEKIDLFLYRHQATHLIDSDLVEFACLAHDLGHPPFGHQGEEILNNKMRHFGGFEGNAQTFRILSVLEKKTLVDITNDDHFKFLFFDKKAIKDRRRGLNLSYRSLASVVKYNRDIPEEIVDLKGNGSCKIEKGIYSNDTGLMEEIRKTLSLPTEKICIEARIMDIADDIAYSTYDLEDAFKGGFLHPLRLHALSNDFLVNVVKEVNKIDEIRDGKVDPCEKDDIRITIEKYASLQLNAATSTAASQLRISEKFSSNGYRRNTFASEAISDFISNVDIKYAFENPNNSEIYFKDPKTLIRIEILKKITYLSQIESSRLKIVEHRGQKLIGELFDILSDREKNYKGQFLIPDIRNSYLVILNKMEEYEKIRDELYVKLTDFFTDFSNDTFKERLKDKSIHKYYASDDDIVALLNAAELKSEELKKHLLSIKNLEESLLLLEKNRNRIICDFIAGMTDRYAVDYMDRLTSIHSTRTIFSYI